MLHKSFWSLWVRLSHIRKTGIPFLCSLLYDAQRGNDNPPPKILASILEEKDIEEAEHNAQHKHFSSAHLVLFKNCFFLDLFSGIPSVLSFWMSDCRAGYHCRCVIWVSI